MIKTHPDRELEFLVGANDCLPVQSLKLAYLLLFYKSNDKILSPMH
jgi:hypothetical protein